MCVDGAKNLRGWLSIRNENRSKTICADVLRGGLNRLYAPVKSDAEVWFHITRERIDALQSSASGPIFLCGGGKFAGRLPEMGEIDRRCLKRAPILLGSGTALFAHA
jgi:hypothetical protein